MLIIPAVDIRNGKCVRLTFGEIGNETVYSDDPVKVAKTWESMGAKRLHIVDLDGAFDGFPKNIGIVENIRKSVKTQIEFGGGVRNMETIDKLINTGIDYVILGTAAVSDTGLVRKALEKYGSKIIIGVDAKSGKVAVNGWTKTSGDDAIEFALSLKKLGVEQIIFTDISRDGALKGPNLESLKDMAEKSALKVTASGGVSSLGDVMKVKSLEKYGVNSIIIGKALFTGDINLGEAIKAAE